MGAARKTIAVDLGTLRSAVESRVRNGFYASTDSVIRAGLLALEREEAATNEWLARLAEEALTDPRPDQPAHQVFEDLRNRR
jgi:antitoxin ParD1/3/4